MADLEALLVVQEHDTALDRLRHRKATLPERAVLAGTKAELAEIATPLAEAEAFRNEGSRSIARLEHEVASAGDKATAIDKMMYSGTISSPRELQNMQAEIDQLRRHQKTLEDSELELLERQETLDADFSALDGRRSKAIATAAAAIVEIDSKVAEIDIEESAEMVARSAAAAVLTPELLALYDTCRERARGVGAARLLGQTCQGCMLTIPSTEVERIRRGGLDGAVEHCDNCGAILVPSM